MAIFMSHIAFVCSFVVVPPEGGLCISGQITRISDLNVIKLKRGKVRNAFYILIRLSLICKVSRISTFNNVKVLGCLEKFWFFDAENKKFM
jgi:hypothetical protein